jgi:hypothetical protein
VGTGMPELTTGMGQREDGVFRSGVLLQVTSSLPSLVFSGVLWCSLVFSGVLLQVLTRLCSVTHMDTYIGIGICFTCTHPHSPPRTHTCQVTKKDGGRQALRH